MTITSEQADTLAKLLREYRSATIEGINFMVTGEELPPDGPIVMPEMNADDEETIREDVETVRCIDELLAVLTA